MKIKISPSLLDTYRVAYHGLYGRDHTAIDNYITKPWEVTEPQSKGTAYHALIEQGPECFRDGDTYRVFEKQLGQTWEFSPQAVQPVIELQPLLQGMTFETWGRNEIRLNGYTIRQNMRYDGLKPHELHEFKTRSRTPKYDDYWKSLQWQCYLLSLPDCERVHYHVFTLNKKNTKCEYTPLVFDRYPEMEANVMEYLTGLLNYLETKPELLNRLKLKY